MNLMNLISYSSDILDGVTVPAPLVVDDVKSAIVMRCGLLTPVYSEPETMKEMFTLWFNTHTWNIQHLINIILSEYSPIENYDRYEDMTIQRNSKETNSGTDISELSGTDIYTVGTTVEDKVSAMNTNTYSEDRKEINSGSNSTDYGKADSYTHGKVVDGEGEEITTSHMHGNIGTVTVQSAISQELALLKSFNIYDWIASQIENDLFITVY